MRLQTYRQFCFSSTEHYIEQIIQNVFLVTSLFKTYFEIVGGKVLFKVKI